MAVEKKVMTPGTGPLARTGDIADVDVTCYGEHVDRIEKFWSSSAGMSPINLELGSDEFIKGFDEVVLQMQVGEVARFRLSSSSGWAFDSGLVPRNTLVVYVVKLLSVKRGCKLDKDDKPMGVKKMVLTPGTGPFARIGEVATVDVACYIKSGGRIENFWSSRGLGNSPISFELGSDKFIKGFDGTVLRMQVGEVAAFSLSSTSGWAFDSGLVPRNTLVVYVVKLLSVKRGYKLDKDDKPMGVKKMVLTPGTGPLARIGEVATVDVACYIKNGDRIENFWSSRGPGNSPISFELGSDKFIRGFDGTVLQMQVGEVAAFGLSSSSGWVFDNGLVPPSTPVLYVVKLLSAKKGSESDEDNEPMGVEKKVLNPGTGPLARIGEVATVDVACYSKDGDRIVKLWSSRDPGNSPISFELGSDSKTLELPGFDGTVLRMQVGEVAAFSLTSSCGCVFNSVLVPRNTPVLYVVKLLSAKRGYESMDVDGYEMDEGDETAY